VAEWHDGETLDEMLDRADRKMYEQKDKVRSDVTKG
jgi:PleD family two-component response regulator